VVDADVATIEALASVEVLAVHAYTAARNAATSGLLGAVPPAIARYLDLALLHHHVHLDAWNAALVRAGRPAVGLAPAGLAADVDGQLAVTTDAAGAMSVVLTVERIAAATYLDAVGKLVSDSAILFAGSVLSIDEQHISVLLFALGQYPVPEAFASAELAYASTASTAAGDDRRVR
jgi:hypothetical protein